MRKHHRLVLIGDFAEDELRQLFKKRGVILHSSLTKNTVDGFQEGVICFNPKRIKPKTVVQLLLNNRTNHHNVALEALENQGECHANQKMAA